MTYGKDMIGAITGAGSGIGRALAQQLNQAGCELHLSDINPDTLAETINSLSRKDVAAHPQLLDVADRQAVHAWADRIEQQSGHVNIVVNNAGVALGATVEETDYKDLDWLININMWGVIQGTMAFLPLLRKSTQGHLVNISSVFGLVSVPTQSAYNTAKFAVRGYTESLRQELAGSHIHVCCVHPGGIRTNIAKESRGGDPAFSKEERDAEFKKLARTTADSAASQIIRAMEKRKKRLLIGNDARYISLISRLFPVRYPSFMPGLGDIGDKVAQ